MIFFRISSRESQGTQKENPLMFGLSYPLNEDQCLDHRFNSNLVPESRGSGSKKRVRVSDKVIEPHYPFLRGTPHCPVNY